MPTRTRTTSRHLPIDIVSVILSRVPSKSLLRFRCVCKSWHDLITDSKFIEFHRNENNNDHILTLHRHNKAPETAFYLRHYKTLMENTRLELPFTKFYEPWRHDLIVAGCSNGLVLIRISREKFSEIILWNPSIRKWKVLPNSEVFPEMLAFVFVPRVNDYKVLKIANCGNHVVKPEIYSLSTNSWKPIENVVGCLLMINWTQKRVVNRVVNGVVNGVVHFLAFDKVFDHQFILSFDMADEVFTRINIPLASDFTMVPMMSKRAIGAVQIYYHIDPLTWAALLWAITKNYDGAATEESLTKQFTADKHVDPLAFLENVEPLGLLKNGELVWKYGPDLGNLHANLCLYDPRLRKVKDFITDFPRTVYALFHYTESLILLNEGD